MNLKHKKYRINKVIIMNKESEENKLRQINKQMQRKLKSARTHVAYSPTHVRVLAHLPGVNQEDISYELQDEKVLLIKGRRYNKLSEYHTSTIKEQIEMEYGDFTRKVTLKCSVKSLEQVPDIVNGEILFIFEINHNDGGNNKKHDNSDQNKKDTIKEEIVKFEDLEQNTGNWAESF